MFSFSLSNTTQLQAQVALCKQIREFIDGFVVNESQTPHLLLNHTGHLVKTFEQLLCTR